MLQQLLQRSSLLGAYIDDVLTAATNAIGRDGMST